MRASVAGIRPFMVRLVGTGAFPNLHRMNVLWVGMEDADPLVEIARRLEAGLEPLGYPRENRDFSPHTTIARAKDRRGPGAARRNLEGHAEGVFREGYLGRIPPKRRVPPPPGPLYSTPRGNPPVRAPSFP